jgi:type IV pilus assembly protein PilW
MMISTNNNHKGFSLIELMVVMAIASIVMAGIYMFYQSNLRSYITQQTLVDMQQDMRAAMYMMTREIRVAGYDPSRSTAATFLIASTAEVQFQLDDNGDGDFDDGGGGDDPNEQVRYVLSNDADGDGVADGTPCNLERQEWADPVQVVALNIDALNFVYFDRDGNDLIDPATGSVPADDIRDIRSVQITIVGRSGAQLPVLFNSGTDNTSYTNQQGTEILGAQNDEFHRIRLTSEVKVRNMGL